MKPLAISIWQPRQEAGETVWARPEPGPFGDHYASRRELRRKHAELPLRVVLFGESAAAGYLYAPHLTPAGVLEVTLRAIGGPDFEVIDLARTNETLGGLRTTVRAALQINPDVLVLWVGNNWTLLETPEVSPYAPAVEDRQAFATALGAEGLAGPVRLARERLTAAASEVFAEIGLIARTVGIPVIVVVPEVNLAAWESRQPVAWLPEDGVARWHRLYVDAADALERGAWQAALTAAEAMEALDGGSCPTAWRLAARARQGLGDPAGAAAAARAEIDANSYSTMAFLGAPQAGPAVQALLRDLARSLRATTVDLPAIFAAHTGSPLPGHRLFLDYCHLTAEGIGIAMAAVASAVFEASGMLESPPTWRDVLARAPAPAVTPEAEAIARLGAAMHGAHRLLTTGPKASILQHGCATALTASPGIAATLVDVVEARSARPPAVLTAALARNAVSPYRLLLQHGWRWDQLDADVITAIRAVLPAASTEIDELLLPLADLPAGGHELAAPPFFFLWEPLERFYPEIMSGGDLTPPAYLRCPWPTTSFAVVTRAHGDMGFEVTARLPSVPACTSRNGSLEVALDGTTVAVVGLTERWSRARLRVSPPAGAGRLRRLTLRWPLPPPASSDPLAAAVERLAEGLTADLHPVFGEVFSLRLFGAG